MATNLNASMTSATGVRSVTPPRRASTTVGPTTIAAFMQHQQQQLERSVGAGSDLNMSLNASFNGAGTANALSNSPGMPSTSSAFVSSGNTFVSGGGGSVVVPSIVGMGSGATLSASQRHSQGATFVSSGGGSLQRGTLTPVPQTSSIDDQQFACSCLVKKSKIFRGFLSLKQNGEQITFVSAGYNVDIRSALVSSVKKKLSVAAGENVACVVVKTNRGVRHAFFGMRDFNEVLTALQNACEVAKSSASVSRHDARSRNPSQKLEDVAEDPLAATKSDPLGNTMKSTASSNSIASAPAAEEPEDRTLSLVVGAALVVVGLLLMWVFVSWVTSATSLHVNADAEPESAILSALESIDRADPAAIMNFALSLPLRCEAVAAKLRTQLWLVGLLIVGLMGYILYTAYHLGVEAELKNMEKREKDKRQSQQRSATAPVIDGSSRVRSSSRMSAASVGAGSGKLTTVGDRLAKPDMSIKLASPLTPAV